MKKNLFLAFTLSLTMLLAACSSNNSTTSTANTNTSNENDKINVVATSFYEYDWVREIIGEDNETLNLTLLVDNGVDLHSYEPSVSDVATISSADLFIYTGGVSESWVDDILASNSGLNSIGIMNILGDNVKMEVSVEGMETEDHDHDHDDEETEEDHDHDHDDEEETEHSHEDEHVWLSLKNAIIAVEALANELADLDPSNADIYSENATTYIASLSALDADFSEMVATAPRDTILFADRFPFLYLATDYGINYYAAFSGCSAETEASFETIVFLAEKVNELSLSTILIIDNGLSDLAATVISSSNADNCSVLVLDSMQSVTAAAINSGTTYYSIMSENLNVLTIALSE